MAYDLVDRRDSTTAHHTSMKDSRDCVRNYITRGMTPAKINLGVAFHAKWFVTVPGQTCQHKVGVGYFSIRFAVCRMVPLTHRDGSDTGMSGTMTFEASNFGPTPPMMISPDGTCGTGSRFKCPGTSCCSQHGVW